VGDTDTALMDSLKVLDPKPPIREADIHRQAFDVKCHKRSSHDATFGDSAGLADDNGPSNLRIVRGPILCPRRNNFFVPLMGQPFLIRALGAPVQVCEDRGRGVSFVGNRFFSLVGRGTYFRAALSIRVR
jgi:hypothetical protein